MLGKIQLYNLGTGGKIGLKKNQPPFWKKNWGTSEKVAVPDIKGGRGGFCMRSGKFQTFYSFFKRNLTLVRVNPNLSFSKLFVAVLLWAQRWCTYNFPEEVIFPPFQAVSGITSADNQQNQDQNNCTEVAPNIKSDFDSR